jgi:hypothetical protein
MRRFAARYFSEQGYQRMIGVVDANNTASIRSNASSGTDRFATLTRIRIGKLIVVWQGGVLRHVRWGAPFFLIVPESTKRRWRRSKNFLCQIVSGKKAHAISAWRHPYVPPV